MAIDKKVINNRNDLEKALLQILSEYPEGIRTSDVYSLIEQKYVPPKEWENHIPKTGYEQGKLRDLGFDDYHNVPQDQLKKLIITEPQWQNEIRWARNNLRKKGILDVTVPKGIWKLNQNPPTIIDQENTDITHNILRTSIDDEFEWEIPQPASDSPFLNFDEEGKITGTSHGQIQGDESYNFFKTQSKAENESVQISLKFESLIDPQRTLIEKVDVGIKGARAKGIYLIRYLKKMINDSFCTKDDLKPGNKLAFSFDNTDNSFIMTIKPKEIPIPPLEKKYWIFIVRDDKVGKIKPQEIYDRRMEDQFWGLRKNWWEINEGDNIIFYLGAPAMVFAGIATAATRIFELDEAKNEKYNHGIKFYTNNFGILIKDAKKFSPPVPIKELESKLDFIKNKNNWMVSLQEGVVSFHKKDYDTIMNYGKPIPEPPHGNGPNINTAIDIIVKSPEKCAYQLIIFYEIIKFTYKNIEISEENIVEGFKDFYLIRKSYKSRLDKDDCNPLQDKTRESILNLLNKNPLRILKGNDIVTEKNELNDALIKELKLENSFEANLLIVKNLLKTYYINELKDKENQIDEILDEWDNNLENFIEDKPYLETFEQDFIEEFGKILQDKKQIILIGPPGTSKTYFAEQYIITQNPKRKYRRVVQFHPSYSYEDFIEGIVVKIEKDHPCYLYKDKIFKKVCFFAKEDPDHSYFLMIDEVNRGNLAKIFGELIYLLENREKEIILTSGDKFCIPPNLYIIGTMNSVDRSIAFVDYALRRRFYFVTMKPDDKILQQWLDKCSDVKEKVFTLYTAINAQINKDLDEHHMLGHTYFFIENEQKLKWAWKYSIFPIIDEYLFGESNKLKEYQTIFEELK